MATNLIPKYHQSPNFTIIPPDCGGHLQLGSIITSISNAEDEPVNIDCRMDIPESKISHHCQKGFTATRSHMFSGRISVLARIVAVEGLGAELSSALERNDDDVYHFSAIDTIYFTPQQQYLAESMNQQDVRDHIESNNYEAVYMITGLKVARGPSVRMSSEKTKGGTFEAGAQQPAGLPLELGPKVNISRESRMEIGFEDSDDFVFGIRIKKLAYKRHWLTRKIQDAPGVIAKDYNKGASMYDDDKVERQQEEILDLGGDYDTEREAEAKIQVEQVDGKTIEESWVLN